MISVKERFLSQYDQLKGDFIKTISEFGLSSDVIAWVDTMCDYNVKGGKMNRGLTVVEVALLLNDTSELSDEFLTPFIALGWCIEWLQASFLVADDIMDSSLMRRGRACWYKREGVGMIAINDCLVLQSVIYQTLKRYFQGKDCYVDLIELFNETKMRTELGQLMDLLTAPAGESCNLEAFTTETYKKIVHYKTAYYSFHLPIVAALLANGQREISKSQELEDILILLGEYFQIQDDFLDCYGDPNVMGKIGTDIREGKCTWLIVMALTSPLLTPTQKDILSENYGKRGDEDGEGGSRAESLVKEIYCNLQLKASFEEYESAVIKKVTSMTDAFAKRDAPLAKALESFASRIFKRQK